MCRPRLYWTAPHGQRGRPSREVAAERRDLFSRARSRAGEAETVYWQDLQKNRENGWALFGLMKALEAQGKNDEAALIQKRFEKAWARADVKLTASRIR